MYKLLESTRKEFLLLTRDIGGLLIIFLMPLALIITVSLIQSGSFQDLQGSDKIPILFVDNDGGDLSQKIRDQLPVFELITSSKEGLFTEQTAREAVFNGDYKLAVVIPANMSRDLKEKIAHNVGQILSEFGLETPAETKHTESTTTPQKEIKLYFDPATQASFKNAIKSNIEKLISQLETQSIYTAFQKELGTEDSPFLEDESIISFKEISPTTDGKAIIPNTTQHNVPAWTLFAMFFIVIPLSINMVKEKTQGTSVRLRTNPVSFATVLGGKISAYLVVCLIQFSLMVGLGVLLFPAIGLPQLEVDSTAFFWLFVVALFSGLAAVGFGILIGTIAKTQEQSAPFGATIVVILAAIGGVWIPVFLMPRFMQLLSNVSPMNWGLRAFQDVLLRQGGLMEILPEIVLLLLFFLTTITISIIYEAKRKAV